MSYDRAIASARRLIASKGEACVWHKPASAAPGADPWRDVRTGADTPHAVQMAFFSGKDLGRGRDESLETANGSDVAKGSEIGIMAAGDFEPLLTDKLVRSDGTTVRIIAIDRLAPSGVPVIYYVRVSARTGS